MQPMFSKMIDLSDPKRAEEFVAQLRPALERLVGAIVRAVDMDPGGLGEYFTSILAVIPAGRPVPVALRETAKTLADVYEPTLILAHPAHRLVPLIHRPETCSIKVTGISIRHP